MQECEIADGAAWAPYQFRFAVHSDPANTLEPPWYSGMAQGEFLSVLCRLYEFTEDSSYIDFAARVFASFLLPRGSSDRWTVRIDSLGFYWIEEYPHEQVPGQTLNGFIASLGGVYDYYLSTRDERAKEVWDMGLTTLRYYLPQYLRKGETSLYCLGHRFPATPGYDRFHVDLLRGLHRMTGDPYFAIMADVFERSARTDSTRSD
jgi:hypothetical protein